MSELSGVKTVHTGLKVGTLLAVMPGTDVRAE